MKKHSDRKLELIPLNKIDAPEGQIRMDITSESIKELAESIASTGLLQPILLRPVKTRYEVVAGHCRFLAHKELMATAIEAFVKAMSAKEAAVIRATENLNRVNLSPLEEAATYKDLIQQHKMKLEEVAAKFGRVPATIKRRMDILKMPPSLQKLVHAKQISVSVAEELWPISDVTSLEYYLQFAIEGGCTKEVARQWCKEWRDSQRRSQTNGVEGRGEMAPFEPRPIFYACDVCLEPVELGKDKVLRICLECHNKIKEATK